MSHDFSHCNNDCCLLRDTCKRYVAWRELVNSGECMDWVSVLMIERGSRDGCFFYIKYDNSDCAAVKC